MKFEAERVSMICESFISNKRSVPSSLAAGMSLVMSLGEIQHELLTGLPAMIGDHSEKSAAFTHACSIIPWVKSEELPNAESKLLKSSS